jgi:hypothetical protein
VVVRYIITLPSYASSFHSHEWAKRVLSDYCLERRLGVPGRERKADPPVLGVE